MTDEERQALKNLTGNIRVIDEENTKVCFGSDFSISDIVRSIRIEIQKAERNLLLRDIIDIYETGITYDEYKESVEEHNKIVAEANSRPFIKDSVSVKLSYMPKRSLLSKEEFDYIKGLYNTNLLNGNRSSKRK